MGEVLLSSNLRFIVSTSLTPSTICFVYVYGQHRSQGNCCPARIPITTSSSHDQNRNSRITPRVVAHIGCVREKSSPGPINAPYLFNYREIGIPPASEDAHATRRSQYNEHCNYRSKNVDQTVYKHIYLLKRPRWSVYCAREHYDCRASVMRRLPR